VSEFEKILEEALERIREEGESLEEVLAGYPEHAAQLRPLLEMSQEFITLQNVSVSAEFKQRGRAALQQHMRAHPRAASARPRMGMRLAVGFATIVLTFTTAATALAQSALPNQALYSWKLASEKVWRAVHVNPVYVDLELSNRRMNELLAVQSDPTLAPVALAAYAASLEVLRQDVARMPTKALSARDIITAQKEAVRSLLNTSGRNPDEFFGILPTLDEVIEANPDQEVPRSTPQLQLPVVTALPPLGGNAEGQEDGEGDAGASDEDAGSVGDAINEVIDTILGSQP
jgi:hypothetical protein